jgi:putative ABC transport system permease protein
VLLGPVVCFPRIKRPRHQHRLTKEGDVNVGDEIVLKIGTLKSTWRVVGLVQGVLSGPFAYANYPYVSRVIRTYGRADRVQVVTDRHDGAYTAQVSRALETHFRRLGLRISSNQTIVEIRKQITAQFNVIIVFLMIMAVLLAVVGGLGLMGTMSINVLERTARSA